MLRDPLLPLVTVSGSQEAGVGQGCPHPPPLKDFSCLLSVKLILPRVLPTLRDLIPFLGSLYSCLQDRSVKPQTHILPYWKHTSRGAKLTWVGKVHFWLHNHALRRQWGRAVTMGIDWSLELHCKISHWDSHKPSLFISHRQVSLSPKLFKRCSQLSM